MTFLPAGEEYWIGIPFAIVCCDLVSRKKKAAAKNRNALGAGRRAV